MRSDFREEIPAELKCFKKSVMLLGVFAGTVCVIYLFSIAEWAVFGTTYLLELDSQVVKIISLVTSEEYRFECYFLKTVGALLLTTWLFHITARRCPCTIRPHRVWPTIDVTTLAIDMPASQDENSEEIDHDIMIQETDPSQSVNYYEEDNTGIGSQAEPGRELKHPRNRGLRCFPLRVEVRQISGMFNCLLPPPTVLWASPRKGKHPKTSRRKPEDI